MPKESMLERSWWSLAIVAVIFLAPSSGLVSLTMPDEPYSGIIGIPDTSHLAKRPIDDSRHLVPVTVTTAQRIGSVMFGMRLADGTPRASPSVHAFISDNIRGPPLA